MTVEEDRAPDKLESRSLPLIILVAIALSSVPCLLSAVLFIINPEYMLQLVLGPPVGAFIPGSSIPMGWPITVAILLLVLIAFGANYLLVRIITNDAPRPKSGLIIVACLFMSISVQFVARCLAILGPSAVQLFKAYFPSGG